MSEQFNVGIQIVDSPKPLLDSYQATATHAYSASFVVNILYFVT